MNTQIITGLISLICTIIGCAVGYLTFNKKNQKDMKCDVYNDTKAKVELDTKMSIMFSNVTEIKNSVQVLNRKLDEFKDSVNMRLSKVEEAVKFAHLRLDKIEKKGK